MKTRQRNVIVAAIDIGSNSVKLAVAEAAAKAAKDSSDSFKIVWQERERARLGETLRRRFLSPEAIQKTAGAIRRFRSVAEKYKADAVVAVATASVREATNADEFVREIRARAGVRVEILSPTEEARLIGLAAALYFQMPEGTLLNVDIGGGSTELSLVNNDGAPRKLFSMRLGAVGLTEKHLSSDPPAEAELQAAREEIKLALEMPARELGGENWRLATGTSGTILNLAALLNVAEETAVELEKLTALNERLAQMTIEERAALSRISPSRAQIIVAGGQILQCVMSALKIPALRPCGYALREGVIIDRLRRIENKS
jgi:exopolyphosphatase / guanosine-5'-triphosphate,3'-diphosphate pyrophosphatase